MSAARAVGAAGDSAGRLQGEGMAEDQREAAAPSRERWLLALHSSGESLGVGLQGLADPGPARLAVFPLGRALANGLLESVESVLPAAAWPRLARLAVALGPGGFTGTRLTVALARTLAQQLALPLDGVGSFALMARRLLAAPEPPASPFWLVQELPRRGLVAGLYGVDPAASGGALEISAPRLYRDEAALAEAGALLVTPSAAATGPVVAGGAGDGAPPSVLRRCPALVVLPEDVDQLLRCSQTAAVAARPAPWQMVLPLYPTSPVGPTP